MFKFHIISPVIALKNNNLDYFSFNNLENCITRLKNMIFITRNKNKFKLQKLKIYITTGRAMNNHDATRDGRSHLPNPNGLQGALVSTRKLAIALRPLHTSNEEQRPLKVGINACALKSLTFWKLWNYLISNYPYSIYVFNLYYWYINVMSINFPYEKKLPW